MAQLWDPLTYDNLMAGTVAHFEQQERRPFSDIAAIEGPGIYALYYEGPMPEYQPIADGSCPIYVGKAVPKGSRTGGTHDLNYPALHLRMREHARSVEQAVNLDIQDFWYRALPIVPVWIAFAEQALIRKYQPVWNSCLDGFGNHPQGSRRATIRSWWDTLHPGRPRKFSATQDKTAAQASQRVKDFWTSRQDESSSS